MKQCLIIAIAVLKTQLPVHCRFVTSRLPHRPLQVAPAFLIATIGLPSIANDLAFAKLHGPVRLALLSNRAY